MLSKQLGGETDAYHSSYLKILDNNPSQRDRVVRGGLTRAMLLRSTDLRLAPLGRGQFSPFSIEKEKYTRAICWDKVNSLRSKFIIGAGKIHVLYKRVLNHSCSTFFFHHIPCLSKRTRTTPPLPLDRIGTGMPLNKDHEKKRM